MPYHPLRERGIGVRYVLTSGNDSDLGVPELALAAIQDPDVRVLLLYLESFTDPERLARTAAIARERDCPIVAIKTGRSEVGIATARSHTGSLATEDRMVDAFFRRHGIWRVDNMSQLARAAELYLKGWRPRQRRVVPISNSGAMCVMAADIAERIGMQLPPLAAGTQDRLKAVLPGFASFRNPVDITGALLSNPGDNGSGLDSQQLQYKQQIEANLHKRIYELLEPVVGRENLRATVTADVDFSQVESTAEEYKPNQGANASSAIRSQQTQESTNSTPSQPTGVPGAATNQPPVPAAAPINGASAPLQTAGGAGKIGRAHV